MCKDKNYYNIQKKKLSKKKTLNLKLEKKLKVLNVFNILREAKLLIFLQYRSLVADRDLKLNLFFIDQNYLFKVITKKCIKKILDFKFLKKKKFSALLCLDSLKAKNELEKILKKHNIGILGYYYNGFFFYKKDFNITFIPKTEALKMIYNLKYLFINHFFRLITLLKRHVLKMFLLLQYKPHI